MQSAFFASRTVLRGAFFASRSGFRTPVEFPAGRNPGRMGGTTDRTPETGERLAGRVLCIPAGVAGELSDSSRVPDSTGDMVTEPMNSFAHLSPQWSWSLAADRWLRPSDFRPLASNSGFGSPVDSPGVQRPDLQPLEQLSPLECTLTKNAPVSPVESTVTKAKDLNSPGMTLLQKTPGGYPSLPHPSSPYS